MEHDTRSLPENVFWTLMMGTHAWIVGTTINAIVGDGPLLFRLVINAAFLWAHVLAIPGAYAKHITASLPGLIFSSVMFNVQPWNAPFL